MKIYQVGGSLRDELMQIESHDRDWVVVGATVAEMKALGYRQKGRHFPVFLHPKTHEEYALARTERKTGSGHRGFQVQSDVSVSLEEDLLRRDLTINAMARGDDDVWVDPFGGQRDLRARKLRHVSEAFVEDPLRVLRVARFAAKFADLGFEVADETLELMRKIVRSNELLSLSAERIFAEWTRALETKVPGRFFEILHRCGAWSQLHPEFSGLDADAPLGERLVTLAAATAAVASTEQRFAAALWDLHCCAALASDDGQRRFCARAKLPNRWLDLANLVCDALARCPALPEAGQAEPAAAALLAWLESLDVWRQSRRFDSFLAVYRAALAAGTIATRRPAQAASLRRWVNSIAQISVRDLPAKGVRGPALATALRERRLAWLRRHALEDR